MAGELVVAEALVPYVRHPYDSDTNFRTAARSARRRKRALHLTGIGVYPLAGDLSSMLVKSHYDAHKGLLKLHVFQACADTLRA